MSLLPLMADELQATIETLEDGSLEKFKRESVLGDLHFGSVTEKLGVIRQILEAFSQERAEELPSGIISGVNGQVAQLEGLLQRMREFTLQQDNPNADRAQIEAEVEGIREWLTQNVRPQLRGAQIKDTTERADLDANLRRARVGSREIERLLSKARAAAGEAGAGRMSSYYSGQADKFSGQARLFLLGVLASVVVLVVLGLFLFVFEPIPFDEATNGPQWEEFVGDLALRVFFLGIAGYALAFTARHYRIARHLAVANDQKRAALDTYPLLIEALPMPEEGGQEVRNLVTAEAARAAFGPIDSGFLSEDRERTVIETQPTLSGLMRPQ